MIYWFCFYQCHFSAGRYLDRSIPLKCQVKFKKENLLEEIIIFLAMTGSHNFLSHPSELPHEHHQPWNNNILFPWVILYWQNLEHSAIFYFRHKKNSFMPEVWYHIYCLQRKCWEYVLSLVWRSHESKVGLVPHLFLWSCKYPVLKYSDANMKINCNLLQSLKRLCRFTEGHERHLQVCGVMKWKGYIKFKQVSHISERKL